MLKKVNGIFTKGFRNYWANDLLTKNQEDMKIQFLKFQNNGRSKMLFVMNHLLY